MKSNILGVSWLNGQFKATTRRSDGTFAEWACPYPVENASELADALTSSVQKTAFQGIKVSFVVQTPRLIYQLADMPLLEGAAQSRFLERKALFLNPLGELAAWSCQSASSGRDGNTVLFHFIPKAFYEEIIQTCRRCGLRCTHLFSPATVLQRSLLPLHIKPDETTLFVAETEESVTLLAGRGNGQILFARSLRHSKGMGARKLGVELSRCAAFTQRRFHQNKIHRAWWIGSQKGFERLKPFSITPLSLSFIKNTPFAWAKGAAEISVLRLDKNVPIGVHKVSRRKQLIRIKKLALVPAVVLLIAVFIALKERRLEADFFDPMLFSFSSYPEESEAEQNLEVDHGKENSASNLPEPFAPQIPWRVNAIWRQPGSHWAVLDGRVLTEGEPFGPGHIESIEEEGVWLRTLTDRLWITF